MIEFLCTQIYVTTTRNGNDTNIQLDNVIRRVTANNKDEAMGKFLRSISHLKHQSKTDPQIYQLDQLITVK